MQNKKKIVKRTVRSRKKTTRVAKHKAISAKKFNPSAILAIKNMEAKTVLLTKNFLKAARKSAGTGNAEVSLKQFVYIALSVLVGLLAGTMLRFLAEMIYLKRAVAQGIVLEQDYFLGLESYLPVSFCAFFLFCGLAFGIFLGFWGWKKVYIEHKKRTWL